MALYGSLVLAFLPAQASSQAWLATQTAPAWRYEEYRPVATMLRGGALPRPLMASVTVQARDEPIERVVEEIARQAGLGVSYGRDVVESRTRVTLDVSRKSAAHALAALERGTHWQVLATPSGRITLLRRERVAAQQGTISGRVMDAATQQPLSGATVAVTGTRLGTTSDAAGRYMIQGVAPGARRVQVSMVGYSPQERSVTVTAAASAVADFSLARQAVQLEGVVAVGYGVQRKRDITGAIGSVSTEELDKVQVPTIAQALQGRVAGVQVTQNSSAPGGGVSIRIRGSGSLGTTNEPLYVVDGVPISGADNNRPSGVPLGSSRFNAPNPLSFLNPEDIASIEVLKDASSTAIYGARGTNGVVLITTKKGSASNSRMEFESSIASQRTAKRYDMLDAQEYARFANDYLRIEYGDTVTVPFPDPSAFGTGVDWQDVIFRDAPMMEHRMSILGGNDQTRFSLSGNYTDQQGIVRSSEFKRFGVRANLQHEFKKGVRVGTNLSITRVLNSIGYTEGGARDSDAGAIGAALNYSPLIPPYHPDGSYTRNSDVVPELVRFGVGGNGLDNPLAIINETTDHGENDRIVGNLFTEFDLIPGMTLRLNGGADLVNNVRSEYFSSQTLRARLAGGAAALGVVEQSHFLGEAILNYQREVGDLHRLDFTAGATVERDEWFGRSTYNRTFPNDLTKFYDIGAGSFPAGPVVDSDYRDWSLLSYLGRVNYSLADKYLLTLTGRADGSSKFGRNNRWGYFPSAAFAWRASEEPFLQNLGLFSDLKLRVSYGLTGNQEIGSYRSLARFGLANYTLDGRVIPGFQPASIANPGLRWEKSRQFDAGFDAAFLDNRLSLTFDVYEKVTDDLLLNVPLPLETGYGSALQNLGSVRNRGVELSATADLLDGVGGGFGWRTMVNLSANRNRVLELGERSEFLGSNFAGGAGLSGLLVREGLPMGVFFGYETDGLFRSQAELDAHVGPAGKPIQPGAVPGQIRFVDQNGDGTISQDDRVILGNPEPDFTLGWTNDFTVGAFNLYAFLQGTVGNDVYSVELNQLARESLSTNKFAPSYLDAWTPQNPNGKWPVINTPVGVGYQGAGTRRGDFTDEHLYDATYLRLRSVMISYNVPERLANRLAGMSSARIFTSLDNALTWTDYPGINPDVNTAGQNNINRGIDFNAYPLARVYRVGLRLGL